MHGANNCNDFCRGLYLLGHRYKTYAATNAEVKANMHAWHRHACIAEAAGEGEAHNMQNTYENNWEIYFIAHFFMIFGVQVPPGGSWE